jgi:precorrin-6A/cobalt-precorrin-6A reductase
MRPDRPRGVPKAVRVLILGGTAEARELATTCAAKPGVEPVSSFAGVISAPRPPAGAVRTGGFGGPGGLADHLRAERYDAVVDATHPFAVTISQSAVEATAAIGVPLLVLRRSGWTARVGDDWRRVPDLPAAVDLLPRLGERVFLTVGRRAVAAFAGVDPCWFLSRSIEPPAPPVPGRLTVLLDRGPFVVDGERALLAEHRIDVLVTRDSGGADAKLTAARERGIPVVLVDRPPPPGGATIVDTAEQAYDWLRRHR